MVELCCTTGAALVVIVALMVWDLSRIRQPRRTGMTAEEHERGAELWGDVWASEVLYRLRYERDNSVDDRVVRCDGGVE